MDTNELEQAFIANLFTILGSREQIDDAVITRESIKENKTACSLSRAEKLSAFNKAGAIDEGNSQKNNIEVNPRFDIVGYNLPAELSTREKIILNAAIWLAHTKVLLISNEIRRELNNQMTELNQDLEALSDPNRREAYEALDKQHNDLVLKVKTIVGDVMQKMRDVRMKRANSDKPAITFYFSAIQRINVPTNHTELFDAAPKLYHLKDLDKLLLNQDPTQNDDLIKGQRALLRAYVYQAFARQFKFLSAHEQQETRVALQSYLHEQINLLEHSWPKIQNELLASTNPKRKSHLTLYREMIIALQQLLKSYEQQVGPLPTELQSKAIMINDLQFHNDLNAYIKENSIDKKFATSDYMPDDVYKLLALFSHKINDTQPVQHGDETVDKYHDLLEVQATLAKLATVPSSSSAPHELAQRINNLSDMVGNKINNIEKNPQFKAMHFLINAERYLKSPEREWNVKFQFHTHKSQETGKAIPTNVAEQLKQIELAKQTGDYEKAKTEFLKIGFNKRHLFLSSEASKKYFKNYKADKTTSDKSKQEEVQDRLDNLFGLKK